MFDNYSLFVDSIDWGILRLIPSWNPKSPKLRREYLSLLRDTIYQVTSTRSQITVCNETSHKLRNGSLTPYLEHHRLYQIKFTIFSLRSSWLSQRFIVNAKITHVKFILKLNKTYINYHSATNEILDVMLNAEIMPNPYT